MAISIVCRASLGIFGEVLSFGSAKMSANAHEPVVEWVYRTAMRVQRQNEWDQNWMKDKYCEKWIFSMG